MAGKSSGQSASINLLNTIIGAGILAMPYALKADGILLGIFVIAFSACTSSFGLYLQGKCCKYVNDGEDASFFALSQLTYPMLSVVFDLAIAVKCFGVGISYLVVIGDLMPKIIESLINEDYLIAHSVLLERNFWITLFMIVIVVPLSFLKKLDSLKYASMIALSSVVYLVVLVVMHFWKDDIINKGPVRFIEPYSATSVFQSFPIFVFSYTCHQNMFSLVNELSDQSGRNINKVISMSIGIACALYILVGVTGYLSFGDNVEPNVIVGYSHSLSSTVGRIAIVILVMLSYPLQCHPARSSINHIIHYFQNFKEISRRPSIATIKSKRSQSSNLSGSTPLMDSVSSPLLKSGALGTTPRSPSASSPAASNYVQTLRVASMSQPPLMQTVLNDNASSVLDMDDEYVEEGNIAVQPLKGKKFYILTTLILIFSYAIAISVTSLARVLAFVGSTGSTSISFILPGIFGYQLIGSEYYSLNGYDGMPVQDRVTRYMALGLSVWGILVMVICLSATIFLGATH
ncbi:hypothetical protein WICPIJ_008926 [Wickerhamomyces pijperi]|uniref:Amino acid transporter transmembrane domain-containing protein n=1 Tax=Wickerhamomyces pijperi TaxID=599730 RepID=A0A9P8TFZ6_WICPI|nr:hypothetical protein WICPIJ_008926 [Wickerhamomyces pijperi]